MIRVIGHEAKAAVAGNCLRDAGWAIDGGLPGALGQRSLSAGIAPFVNGRGTVSDGQVVGLTTSGGGGVGDPRLRDRDLVRRDLREGKISVRAARDVYGLEV